MKIKCIASNGAILKGYKMPVGYFDTSLFNTNIGQEYFVLGVLLSENCIFYLIDVGSPHFIPFQCFEIIDNSIPSFWKTKVYTIKDECYPYIQLIMGYENLLDNKYLDELSEMKANAINIFYEYLSLYPH